MMLNIRQSMKRIALLAVCWGSTPLLPALERQKQADLCEFKASLVYRESSRTARATQKSPVLKNIIIIII